MRKLFLNFKLKNIIILNIFSFSIFSIYGFYKIPECNCFWMHDASIKVDHKWLTYYLSYLFLLPSLISTITLKFKIDINNKVILGHYFICLISILSLYISLNEPCKFINGGYFIFINSSLILLYYLTKLTCFLSIIYIIIKVSISIFIKLRN